MRCRRTLITLTIAATLGACTSTGTSPSAGNTPLSTAADRPEADGAAGPSDLLLSLLTPASGDDMRAVNDLQRADQRLFSDAMQQCMAQEGFELNYHSKEPADRIPRFFDFPDLASIEKYGFGGDQQDYWSDAMQLLEAASVRVGGGPQDGTGEESTEALPASMSAGEAQALLDADRACRAEAEGDSPLTQFQQGHSALRSGWTEELNGLEDSGELDEAERTWADCMAGHGWAADSQSEFFGLVNRLQMQDADPEDAQAVQQDPVDAYVDCTAKLEEIRQPLRQQLREQFVDANYGALVEAEQDLRDVIEELNE